MDSKALCGRMLELCLTKQPPVLHTFNSAVGRYERVFEVQPFLTRLVDEGRLRKLHHVATRVQTQEETAARVQAQEETAARVQAKEETAARLKRKEKHLLYLLAVCETDPEDNETPKVVSELLEKLKALQDKLKLPDGGQ